VLFRKEQPGTAAPLLDVCATFYDVEGNILRRERARARARELDPDDAQEAAYLDFYGMTHIAVLDAVIELQELHRSDAVSFAMHWEIRTQRVAGSVAAVLAAEARVPVP